jgi:membrane protease YdiL (CAAX protease family)
VASSAPVRRLLEYWGGYWRFLKSPALPERRIEFGREAVADVAALLLLDIIIAATFLIAVALAESGGVELPQPIDDDLGPVALLIFVVFVAPPIEEWLFRTPLSGQRRSLIGAAIIWPLLFALTAAALLEPLDGREGLLILGAWLLATGVPLAYLVSDRDAPERFKRRFPYAFWLSSIAFGLMHVFNYEQPFALLPVLMIFPQFTGGTMLAYVRVRYGMWANIAQHSAYNALVMVLYFAWPEQFEF